MRNDVIAGSHRCLLVWEDGWGEHLCGEPLDHDGDHRCHCDATVRDVTLRVAAEGE